MANEEHVALLKQGVEAWNAWRQEDPDIRPDLTRADLRGADLRGVNLRSAQIGGAWLEGADLSGARLWLARLEEAYLHRANLSGADLVGAEFWRAHLGEANLIRADLRQASFSMAYLGEADLTGANLFEANFAEACLAKAHLRGADLTRANLVVTDFTDADLTGCRIYGISAWGLKLSEGTKQHNLIITPEGEPEVTVDNIEVAQFVYLLLHNPKIRDVIDTIGKKGVLLLGRFTEGRLTILERLREALRQRSYLPMVFNFDKPETKDFTDTVRLLADLSHFVIVDLSYPRSVPLELQVLVPNNAIPFVSIIEQGQDPFAMFGDLQKYDWVLDVISYSSVDRLIEALEPEVIRPAELKFNELLERRAKKLRIKSV